MSKVKIKIDNIYHEYKKSQHFYVAEFILYGAYDQNGDPVKGDPSGEQKVWVPYSSGVMALMQEVKDWVASELECSSDSVVCVV